MNYLDFGNPAYDTTCEVDVCPKCNGTGEVDGETCSRCDGEGEVEYEPYNPKYDRERD